MNTMNCLHSDLLKMTDKEKLQHLSRVVDGVETVRIFDGTSEDTIELSYQGREFKPLRWNSSAQQLMLQESIDSLAEDGYRLACCYSKEEMVYSHLYPASEEGYRMSIIEAVLIKYGVLKCATECEIEEEMES